MTAIVETHALTKTYGSARGIEEVTLLVEEGDAFGFLGPNGAGKTTTIRLLMGLLRPTAGHAAVAGLDCWRDSTAVKRIVGYLPGEFAFDPSLTGSQIITYLANLRGGVDRAYMRSLVERLALDPSRRYREYSTGNRQKVALVQALMHRPRLLILDEPTSGLDLLNQLELYSILGEVRRAGCTVFLSSHNLPEVERTCERVGIIREGRLIRVDQVNTLKDIQRHIVEVSFAGAAAPRWFEAVPGVLSITPSDDGTRLELQVQGDLRGVLKTAANHDAVGLRSREPSLEEVFLHLYGAAPASGAGAQ